MNFEKYRKRLVDDISKIYFDARIQLLKNNNLSDFYKIIRKVGERYRLREVEEFCVERDIKEWVIIGSDDYVQYNCMIMRDSGYRIVGVTNMDFCELSGGARFLNENDVREYFEKDTIGIIINQRDTELLPDDARDSNNVLVMSSHIIGRNGTQYFDYFKPEGQESFLDAGALDGATSNQFVEWCEGRYSQIYAVEPNPLMIDICRRNLSKYGNKVKVFNNALWDCCGELLFNNENSKWDAKVSETGKIVVNGVSVDSILHEKRVTFMKFDVEGAEIHALKGGEKTILLNNPRMAISVYHNENDLIEIMDYLVSLNQDYKFAIRHYHSDLIETILYVF